MTHRSCRPRFPSSSISLAYLAGALLLGSLIGVESYGDELLLRDDFQRQETDDSKEQIGNGWTSNSKSRAQGNKQVDLVDGAMHIVRHPVADHGVSVVQDLQFKNATIEMRFKIGQGDELGINIADMKEKSVHAGHLCVAKIRLGKVSIQDLKTGRMKLAMREKSKAKTLSKEDKAVIASKERSFPIKLSPNEWHRLKVQIVDDTMTLSIDSEQVAQFQSAGIGHPTKSRLRLAVAKDAWVDDLTVYRND